jgi:hypothetical protein
MRHTSFEIVKQPIRPIDTPPPAANAALSVSPSEQEKRLESTEDG